MIAIAIYVALGLIAGMLLIMLLFGVRSMMHKKVKTLTMVLIVVPILLLLVLGMVMGDWDLAAIWTTFIMLAIASLSLLLSGVRGIFT